MKRVLVTGAQGFIGRFVVDQLLNENVEVLAIGRSPENHLTFTHVITLGNTQRPAPLPVSIQQTLSESKYYRYQAVDLIDRTGIDNVIASFEPNWVIHLASGLRGDPTEKLIAGNIVGTTNLIDSLNSVGNCEKLVIASTCGVYGSLSPGEPAFVESATHRPADFYSASKSAMEILTRNLAHRYELPTVWGRIFNVVGPGQDERHVCGRFVSVATEILRGTKTPEMEVGNLDSTRDFIDVRDVAKAMILICKAGVDGTSYNVCNGIEIRISHILDCVLEAAGLADSIRVNVLPSRDSDVSRNVGDNSAVKAIGYEPEFDISKAIKDLMSYYLHFEPT